MIWPRNEVEVVERYSRELTDVEEAIARYVMAGMKAKAISAWLGISEQAVRHRLLKVYDKTGMSSRIELVSYLREHRILDDKFPFYGS